MENSQTSPPTMEKSVSGNLTENSTHNEPVGSPNSSAIKRPLQKTVSKLPNLSNVKKKKKF